jgi:hypothetical protein
VIKQSLIKKNTMDIDSRTITNQVAKGRTILLTVISGCAFLFLSISILTAQTNALVSPPLGSFSELAKHVSPSVMNISVEEVVKGQEQRNQRLE